MDENNTLETVSNHEIIGIKDVTINPNIEDADGIIDIDVHAKKVNAGIRTVNENLSPVFPQACAENSEEERNGAFISNPVADIEEPELTQESIKPFDVECKKPAQISFTLKLMVLSFGLSSLLPWNMIINAAGFFRVRLKGSMFENSFPNYIQAVGVICNLVGSAANVYVSKKINAGLLSVGSNVFLGVFIGIISVLSSVNTGSWRDAFFIICLFCIIILAFGHSFLTSNINAILTMFSPGLIVW